MEIQVEHPVTKSKTPVMVDEETLQLMQQEHDLETDEQCSKLLKDRMQRILNRVAQGSYIPKFNDVDILAVQMLVTNRMVSGDPAKKLVKALRKWSEERRKVRTRLPYQEFAATLQRLIYELEDKASFLEYANGELYDMIQEHKNSSEFVSNLLIMYKRLVPVAQGEGDMEDFVDPPVLRAVKAVLEQDDQTPSKRVMGRVKIMIEALQQIQTQEPWNTPEEKSSTN